MVQDLLYFPSLPVKRDEDKGGERETAGRDGEIEMTGEKDGEGNDRLAERDE